MVQGSIEHEIQNAPALRRDPRWQLVERIVASPHLAKSSRLCGFLQFITAETLSGRGDLLNEQRIGVHVFERRDNYDSAEDNIVRSHASRLRQRLEAYFLVEGKDEPLRLILRRGSYIPQFENASNGAQADLSASIEVPPSTSGATVRELPSAMSPAAGRTPNTVVWILSVALMISSLLAAYEWRSHRVLVANQRSQSPVMRAFWTEIFPPGQRALIVPADSSLVLYENLTGRTVSLPDYINKTYMTAAPDIPSQNPEAIANRVGHRRLTSIADIELTSAILRVPEILLAKPQIRFARDLQLADLKEANVILIGAQESDPWLSLFQSKLNFVITDDQSSRVFTVWNKFPQKGELAQYHLAPSDPTHTAYALVALTPNLAGTGMVLIIEGTSIAGTEAAADFLTDGSKIEKTLEPSFKQDGRIPSFEVLLQTINIDGSAPQSKIIAARMYH